MNARRVLAAALCAVVALGLGACFGTPPRRSAPADTVATPEAVPPPAPPVAAPSNGDAIPRVEPRSRYGNPPFYEVFGKRYYVLSSNIGYLERGVASWYGPRFHKIRTSTGEPYDMYGMSAAHKTLPLPAYVRVTNLQNGRTVVVRVNDRGPFVDNRIIDLSYTAAVKLDMLRNGTAMVEVRALDPSLPAQVQAAPVSASASAPEGAAAGNPATAGNSAAAGSSATAGNSGANVALFVQAGAFANPANAQRLATELRGGGYGKIFVRDDDIAGRRMYRVRIGPVPDVAEFDRIVAALERAGVRDAHLALD